MNKTPNFNLNLPDPNDQSQIADVSKISENFETIDTELKKAQDCSKGDPGKDGNDGNGIQSVNLISTVDRVKTYRITFTDGTHFDYYVTDGETGQQGGKGDPGTGVTSVSIDEDGELIVTLSDGTEIDAGNVFQDLTDINEKIINAYPARTASGASPLEIQDGAKDIPIKSAALSLDKPYQDGSGTPSDENVREIVKPAYIDSTMVSPSLPADFYAGEVDLAKGTIKKTWEKIVADPSATVFHPASGTTPPFGVISLFKAGISGNTPNNIISDKYKSEVKTIPGNVYVTTLDGLRISVVFNDSSISTREEMIAYMNENPINIAYRLKTPETTTFTPEEIKTVLGENEFYAEFHDAYDNPFTDATLSVEYRADPTLVLQELLNQ